MDGKEYAVQDNFEVLTNPNKCILEWKSARDGTVFKGAVEAGVDKQGVSQYIFINFYCNNFILEYK